MKKICMSNIKYFNQYLSSKKMFKSTLSLANVDVFVLVCAQMIKDYANEFQCHVQCSKTFHS